MGNLLIKFSVFPLITKFGKSPEEIITILSETIFSDYDVKDNKGMVSVYEKEKSRIYGEDVSDYADIFTVKEWEEAVEEGWFGDYDGSGYWVKDGKECGDEVFSSPPLDATHVAWYNK